MAPHVLSVSIEMTSESRLSSIWLLLSSIFVLCTSSSSISVVSFGVQTSTVWWADTSASTDIQLWTNNTLYKCTFDSMAKNTTYSCDENSWTIASDHGVICNDGTSDYKLIIENPNADDIGIESAFLELDDATYSIDAWCLPDDAEVLEYNKRWIRTYFNNTCSSGYTAYTDLCIDQEPRDCAPHRVMLYFDMDNPNGTSYDAKWVDSTGLCMSPTNIETSSHGLFMIGDSRMNFTESVNYCESLGYQLASIHNDAENAEALELCTEWVSVCWIGGRRIDRTQYGYHWLDGSDWKYTKWNNAEPNDQGGIEDCVELLPNGKWNDNRCGPSRRPLCRIIAGTIHLVSIDECIQMTLNMSPSLTLK